MRTDERFLVDASEFLGTSPRKLGAIYKFSQTGSHAMATVQSKKPIVDGAAMSATFVISTATVDRVGDVLIPRGCDLINYTKNPAVFWAHGLEGISTPIGTSNDRDESLSVSITDDDVSATCFFSQKNLEAGQIFELVSEGIVRAASVRETPLKSRMIQRNGETIVQVDAWTLEEWSICGLGVNPDALRKCFSKNKLCGKPIAESICKSLTAFLPPKQAIGKGFGNVKAAAKDDVTDADMETPADEAPEATEPPDSKDGKNVSDKPADKPEEKPVDDKGKTGGMVDPAMMPYSQKSLVKCHDSVKSACKCFEKAMGPEERPLVEHPEVREGLKSINDAMKDGLEGLKGLHVKCYGEKIKDDADGDGAGESDQDESGSGDGSSDMKSWLADSTAGRLQMAGLEHRLKSIASENNLTPVQRKLLIEASGHIGRLVSQAKAYKPAPVTPAKDPDAEKLAKIEKELDALLGKSKV